MYTHNLENYYKVSLNALYTLIPRVNIRRVLREYYPDIVKICI
jgi:starch phosphorylase